jgi:hypothetical protein
MEYTPPSDSVQQFKQLHYGGLLPIGDFLLSIQSTPILLITSCLRCIEEAVSSTLAQPNPILLFQHLKTGILLDPQLSSLLVLLVHSQEFQRAITTIPQY